MRRANEQERLKFIQSHPHLWYIKIRELERRIEELEKLFKEGTPDRG